MANTKHEGIAKKLEIAANISIVIVALVGVAIFANNYWLKSEPKHIAVGEQFHLENANWQASGGAVVLGISTTCHFCTESAGFYRELVKECAAKHLHTVAVLPQPVGEAKRYLAGEGVVVDEIRESPLLKLKITGTPTLLLIDSKGEVRAMWFGKLRPDQEKQVLATLGS